MEGYGNDNPGVKSPLSEKNEIVDGDMTFEEWQASLTPEQKVAMGTHVKEANQGALQNLEIPMQKRYVLRTAERYGISTGEVNGSNR